MKCPKCNRKMVFNRDIKDYYCEKCKSSLEDLEDEFEPESVIPKKAKKIKSEPKEDKELEEEVAISSPIADSATVRGLLFMMLGAILLLVGQLVCLYLLIIGYFLIIMGFFLIFKDRKKYPKEHKKNMLIALIPFAIWIIIFIFFNIVSYQLGTPFADEVADLEDDEIIPTDLIKDYFEDSEIIYVLSLLITTFFVLLRYFTIENLIKPIYKKILVLVVMLILIGGVIGLYSSLMYYDSISDNLNDTTKEDFIKREYNLTKEPEQFIINLQYTGSFLLIIGEVLMILCFYWSYTNQRDLSKMEQN